MQSIIKKVVWVCLAIIPFLALYVASGGTFDLISSNPAGFYFPFISGKNIAFRILVEIALAGWVVLALKDASYRIVFKKSPLMIAYVTFITIIFIADIFGVDRDRSIWSNFERMEGFVGHIHMFAYFFLLTVMLPTIQDWQKMFKIFLASNILVLIYGYGQLLGAKGYIFADNFPKMAEWFSSRFPIHMSSNRLDATIGNSAYFAIFCLISAGIAGLLWVQSKETKRQWLYPTLIVLNLIALFYSGTRGTMIGLAAGLIVSLSLIAWHEKGHSRKVLIGTLIGMITVVSLIFTFKNTDFVKNSPTLERISSISPTDLTGSSRIYIWKISYEAWLERPILGYGQDNFGYIFARKFIPEKMWNLEAWYDRSHDVFFDWLVAGGILGLLSYLSLYVVALWLMWRKHNTMSVREKSIITGLIAGYFVHNIFVFDNLTSYILFFAILAYIVVRTRADGDLHKGGSMADDEQIKYLWMPIIAIVFLTTFYFVNYRAIKTNNLLVNAMNISELIKTMSFADALKVSRESFVKAISMGGTGGEEAREQFLQMGARIAQVEIPSSLTKEEKDIAVRAVNEFVGSVRDDINKSLSSHAEDVRMLSIYGSFLISTGDSPFAEKVLTMAHKIAPNKQITSFDLIRAYLTQDKFSDAYKLSRETYDSAKAFPDALKWYLISAAYAKSFNEARAYIEKNGQSIPFDGDVFNALVSSGQTSVAISLLNDEKRKHPELSAQIDGYIKTLLAPKKK